MNNADEKNEHVTKLSQCFVHLLIMQMNEKYKSLKKKSKFEEKFEETLMNQVSLLNSPSTPISPLSSRENVTTHQLNQQNFSRVDSTLCQKPIKLQMQASLTPREIFPETYQRKLNKPERFDYESAYEVRYWKLQDKKVEKLNLIGFNHET